MFKLLICRQKIDVNLYILLSQINDYVYKMSAPLANMHTFTNKMHCNINTAKVCLNS